MKKILISLIMLAYLTGCSYADTSSDSTSNSELVIDQTMDDTNSTAFNGTLNNFSTTTLEGDKFSNEDFADYKLTMVDIWQTSCIVCIDDFPVLNTLYNQLPDGVNLIGICCDGSVSSDGANDILDKYNVKYTNLSDSQELWDTLLYEITGTPTTVFVDSQGNVVGEIIEGVPYVDHDYELVDIYIEEINNRLEQIEG